MDLEFLQTLDGQILLGVAVAAVAIGIGAIFLFSSKKPKGLTSYWTLLFLFFFCLSIDFLFLGMD